VPASDAFALDLDTAKNSSLYAVAVAILIALAAVWLVKQVVTKVLSVGILLAIAGLVWSQRTELTDCADDVTAAWTVAGATGVSDDTTCTFFGRDVTIPGRPEILIPTSTTVPA